MEWLIGFALLMTLFCTEDRVVLLTAIVAMTALGIAVILR